jgi:4-amino-4-deoxy-L-arabinose transferase-like glycosyltransferase
VTDLRTPAHEDLAADDLADRAAPHDGGGEPDDASVLPTEGRSGTDWSFYRWLALIAAASLLWRIVFIAIWRWDLPIWGDAFFYHESGKLVADGEGFVNPLLRDEQAADHPPLYIVFLALLSMLGIRSGNSHIVATAVVGTASIVFAGLAGREIAGRRSGLIAAGLFTVYAAIWSWDGMLLSETFAILFVTALIWAVYRFRRVPSWWGAVGLGVLLALATFSRAELLLLSLLVVTPVILLVRSRSWRTRIGWLVTAGAACLAVLSPWLAYNMSRFEGTVLLSNGAEITLASASCDRTYYGEYTGYWAMECAIQFLEENGFEGADGEQSERSEVLLREAVDYISANRERVPYVVLARWGRITGLWNPIQQSDLDRFPEGRDGWVTKLALVQWYPLVLLAGGGAIALRRRKVPIYPLLGPVVTVLVAITVMFATNRYRASAEGAIALLAAVGIDAVFRWYRRLRDDPEDRPVPPDDPPPPDDDVDAPADGADAPAAASAASPGTAIGRS